MKRFSVLGRPGSDLLFQVLRLSTIGAGEFNGRVRDGIGFRLPARTTRPAEDRKASWSFVSPRGFATSDLLMSEASMGIE
jgi:hypothetical protein